MKWEGTKGAVRAQLGLLLDYPRGGEDRLEVVTDDRLDEGWRAVPFEGSWFPDAFIGSMSVLQRFVEGSIPRSRRRSTTSSAPWPSSRRPTARPPPVASHPIRQQCRQRRRRSTMRLARLGAIGAESPTVVVDGIHHDLRPLLDELGVDDIGPAFFAADGLARVAAALEAGRSPRCRRRRPARRARRSPARARSSASGSTTATTPPRPVRRCPTSPSSS